MGANKINSGDSLRKGPHSASGWNYVVESANNYHGRRATGDPVGPQPNRRSWHAVITVQNNCAVDLRLGEVVELDGAAISDDAISNDNLWLLGVDSTLDKPGWAITREPIPYNSESPNTGPAVVAGVCLAYIQFPDDSHEQLYAERKAEQRVLHASDSGPVKIIHVGPAGDAEWEYLCLVQIGSEPQPALVRFELIDQLDEGGHAKAKLLDEDWADTETEIEVRDGIPGGMWAGTAGFKGWAIKTSETHTDDPEEPEEGEEEVPPATRPIHDIVVMEQVAIFAEATLSAALCPDADPAPTTIAVSGFTTQPFGIYTRSPATTPTSVKVGTIKAGTSGDKIRLRRINNNMPAPDWEIVSIDKHKVSPVVNVAWTGTILKQTKRTGWWEQCSTTETDSTIDTPGGC